METKEAPKRKYKKHKIGFKVAVVHKLYVKEAEKEYEPLYVEVRAKNQSTLIRSRFQCDIVASDIRLLEENRIISECLEVEKQQISTSVRKEIELTGENFLMREWYRKFSQSDDRKGLHDLYIEYLTSFFLKVVKERNIDKSLIPYNLDKTADNWALVTAIKFLSAFGVKDFQEPLDVIDSIVEFQSEEVNFLIHQQRFQGIGRFNITASIVKSDLERGSIFNILSYLSENQIDNKFYIDLFSKIVKILRT